MTDAAQFIDTHLRACLPPGVPPSYSKIVQAVFVGRGKDRQALADLIMFDGLPAKVMIRTTGLKPHRFIDLPGGDVSFEDGRWIRICRTTLEPMPAQMPLFEDHRHDH